MQTNVIPVDGMVITEDTTFAPGVYPLRQGITIGADGVTLDGGGALLVAALLLGLANAVVRPLLVVLTLPLTLLSFGLFLLVINALVLMLVARLVNGFHLDGFWTAFWASIFMSLLSLMLGLVLGGTPEFTIETSPGPGQTWL